MLTQEGCIQMHATLFRFLFVTLFFFHLLVYHIKSQRNILTFVVVTSENVEYVFKAQYIWYKLMCICTENSDLTLFQQTPTSLLRT